MPEAPHRSSPDPLDTAATFEIPDYTLLRRIGRGSYGDVWLARSVTGVFRVIKVVQRNRFEDDRPYLRELEGISRFQAAVSGRPRQLALLHVGCNDDAGYFYYVMEPADDVDSGSAIDPDRYVPLTLREMLKRRGRLPAQECIQFALELARGLAVLHGENLSHRDIKPSNVIFVQRVPKLADVGLVASADATLTGVGTPGYLPPEGPGSVAADIYSLGKVLYEIATGLDQGQYPKIPRELAEHQDAPLLREINSIVLKACSPYPTQRHASAEHLARDLELVQAGRSVAFYEEFRKRSRAIVAVTASLALLAGLAATLFVWRTRVLQRANNETRRALYRSDLAVAQLARTSGDLGRARAALARQIPAKGQEDLRGLEWSILAQSVRGEGTPLEPVPNPVAISKIAVDPSGRWVAASFIDDRVGVWDLRNGRVARVIENARVLGGFLPDGQIVVDEPDRAIRYESPTGGGGQILPIGQRLYSLLTNGHVLVVSPEGDIIFQVINPIGKSITGQFNLSSINPELVNSSQDISPDGTRIVVGAYIDRGAIRDRLLIAGSIATGQELWRIRPQTRIVWLKWSAANNAIAANIGGLGVTILDPENGRTLATMTGHAARVQDGQFSDDGKYFATASADQSVRVWNTGTGEPIAVHRGLGRPATSVSWFSGTNFLIASDDSGAMRVFHQRKSHRPEALGGLFSDLHGDLAFSPDSQLIAVTETTNRVAIVDYQDFARVRVIEGLFQPIAFIRSGAELLAFSSDWSIWRYRFFSNDYQRLGIGLPQDFSLDGWAISSDFSQGVFSGSVGRLLILDFLKPSVRELLHSATNHIWALAFARNGAEVWAGSEGGTIQRWQSNDLSPLDAETSIVGDIQAIAPSADGRWLAVSLFNDASLRIWDRILRTWLPPRFSHRRYIQSLCFTDSGDRLISGGVDGRVIIWRVPDFEEVAALELAADRPQDGDEGIAALRLGPSHSGIAALTEDGRLNIWRAR